MCSYFFFFLFIEWTIEAMDWTNKLTCKKKNYEIKLDNLNEANLSVFTYRHTACL